MSPRNSRRKHKILREYCFDYLTVRCKLPQQERFRLAIVDGFAGGGRYQCGTSGSPLIFIEELKRATEAVNTHRAAQGLNAIEVECLLVFNVPFTLLKGLVDVLITFLIYKKLSPILHK